MGRSISRCGDVSLRGSTVSLEMVKMWFYVLHMHAAIV